MTVYKFWPVLPHRMDTETGNWIVQGMLENGQIGDRIGLTKSASSSSRLNHTGLIEWTKDVHLDAQWTVVNTLKRVSKDANVALNIPLRLQCSTVCPVMPFQLKMDGESPFQKATQRFHGPPYISLKISSPSSTPRSTMFQPL